MGATNAACFCCECGTRVEEVVHRSPSHAGDEGGEEVSHYSAQASCRLRIIFASDVYLLDNLPALKTLVAQESKGFLKTNVVTALPGDFLAPSLLSSLDSGYSMVKAMNKIPIDMVCFGNHDGNDVPYGKLVHRIDEFKGKWLNSNMPDFEPELPASSFHSLTGEDGTPGARKVAFLGLLMGGAQFQSMYRPEAFGGAHTNMVPVLEAARSCVEVCHQQHSDLDEVIPLTHQDVAEDLLLADMGLFPIILGGHDHEQMEEVSKTTGCRVVKPGQDAKLAAIVDIVWYTSEKREKPLVSVQFKAVSDFKADPELAEFVHKAHGPVRELESACLYAIPEGETLSSVKARYQDCTMAKVLATAVRDCLGCDGVIINSGTVRGDREYTGGISYGDLHRECPFQSNMVVVRMPFSILKEAVRWSRKNWWDIEKGAPPKEAAKALQSDAGMKIVDHVPTTIKGEQVADDEDTDIGIDAYVLKKNPIFAEYCQTYPNRIPAEDAGRPLLPIIVEYFCSEIWRQLIDRSSDAVLSKAGIKSLRTKSKDPTWDDMGTTPSAADFKNSVHQLFELFDQDHSGGISESELQRVISNTLGPKLSSAIVVKQLLNLVDVDVDGIIDESELHEAIRKIAARD